MYSVYHLPTHFIDFTYHSFLVYYITWESHENRCCVTYYIIRVCRGNLQEPMRFWHLIVRSVNSRSKRGTSCFNTRKPAILFLHNYLVLGVYQFKCLCCLRCPLLLLRIFSSFLLFNSWRKVTSFIKQMTYKFFSLLSIRRKLKKYVHVIISSAVWSIWPTISQQMKLSKHQK